MYKSKVCSDTDLHTEGTAVLWVVIETEAVNSLNFGSSHHRLQNPSQTVNHKWTQV